MEIFKYYALCWKIQKNMVCGHLIGTRHEVVSKNAKKINSLFSAQISREMELDPYEAEPRISKAKLKILPIEVRPGYKEKDGSYPTTSSFKIAVAAVYGETSQGFFECFLPFLKESFFFYNLDQINNLIDHFSKNIFQNMNPETLHRYIMPNRPWLEEFSVRQKEPRATIETMQQEKQAPTLSKIAEKFPRSKAMRSRTQIFPQVAWEQTENIELVVEKITKENANLILVGANGVGKSVILLEAIRKIFRQDQNKNKRYFWRTAPHRITSGAKYLGDWEEICEQMLDDLQRIRGILWLTNFMDVFHVGGAGAEDSIAAFMSSYLRDGRVQIVGELTQHEFERAQVLLPGFIQYFQVVYIDEMAIQKIFKILQTFQKYAASKLNVKIETNAIELAYRLLNRFVKYESFPGKASQFLSQCINDVLLSEQNEIHQEDIIQTFIEKTGMPELFLYDHLLLDQKKLESFFTSKIMGQSQAIEKICQVVKIFKTGLNDPEKPIATLLFAGPTGVGKTASTNALAEYFFGQGQKKHPLIRMDMSEFQHPAQIGRLIGEGKTSGKLVREIRERPFSVVLFDEIEKAHPAVFDALLTILDEGILIDNLGRITDFRNTIIVMTSNLGSQASSKMGFDSQQKIDYEISVRKFFRPEFFNRLDAVVSFSSLTKESIEKIIKKELGEIQEREGIKTRHIKLHFSQSVFDVLLEKGFDERYGARPLQRAIEKLIIAAIAQYIMKNKPNKCKLNIGYKNGVTIQKK